MNSFGEKIRFTSFGESHGVAVGGVLEGLEAGLRIDFAVIRDELQRRSGKGDPGTSPRSASEEDEVEWLSGLLDGVTTGTPVAFLIRNSDSRPEDYEWMKAHFRPGHADYTYQVKYGIRDWRGGGRSSARETAGRVVAGAISKMILGRSGIAIHAEVVQIGNETDPSRFDELLREVRSEGDTIGGIVECRVTGLPAGIGDPIFDKLQSHLAAAIMSINGCKGFEYGTGFSGMSYKGSELYTEQEGPSVSSGGIEGGISNGLPLVFRCAFKPAATMTKRYGGRHDACIAVRGAVVVEAMTALVLVNFHA